MHIPICPISVANFIVLLYTLDFTKDVAAISYLSFDRGVTGNADIILTY